MPETFMITTSDNPYNPYTQFREWYNFDRMMGYNTLEYLGNKLRDVDVIKDEELRAQVVQEALDEMLDFNLYGNMVKAYPPPDYVSSLKTST